MLSIGRLSCEHFISVGRTKHTRVMALNINKCFDLSIAVNLTAFIFGIVIGFTGPNLELFKSENSPLASGSITNDEESWISSLAAFGAMGFTLVFGWLSEKFGRKTAILLIGIPQTVSDSFPSILSFY